MCFANKIGSGYLVFIGTINRGQISDCFFRVSTREVFEYPVVCGFFLGYDLGEHRAVRFYLNRRSAVKTLGNSNRGDPMTVSRGSAELKAFPAVLHGISINNGFFYFGIIKIDIKRHTRCYRVPITCLIFC